MAKTPKDYEKNARTTICEEHLAKRKKVGRKYTLEKYEKEKNCCLNCDLKRARAWGRPNENDISRMLDNYKRTRNHHPDKYENLLKELEKFTFAREREDLDSLDRRVWSQFGNCEKHGDPYWTDEDYKKLYEKLTGEIGTQ